ncbi:MAG: shikimate kinase [Bacteroidales bacterium]|nr:shikimate kinase [Bacteroidales bacterium]
MRYFIIGFKNCGKTTLGKKLARKLNMEFIDLDEEIERRTGKSIPEIYSEEGDTEFRNKEWETLLSVVKNENIVVALGGGAPCHCDNMNLIEKHGEVIYIMLDDDTLVSRLKQATVDRPVVLNKSDEELRDYIKDIRYRCEHHYMRAKYIVEGKNIKIDNIIEILKKKLV